LPAAPLPAHHFLQPQPALDGGRGFLQDVEGILGHRVAVVERAVDFDYLEGRLLLSRGRTEKIIFKIFPFGIANAVGGYIYPSLIHLP
jgi:hypothetical protein